MLCGFSVCSIASYGIKQKIKMQRNRSRRENSRKLLLCVPNPLYNNHTKAIKLISTFWNFKVIHNNISIEWQLFFTDQGGSKYMYFLIDNSVKSMHFDITFHFHSQGVQNCQQLSHQARKQCARMIFDLCGCVHIFVGWRIHFIDHSNWSFRKILQRRGELINATSKEN